MTAILVSSQSTPNVWYLTGDTELRVYANQAFHTSDSKFVPQGVVDEKTYYDKVAVTVNTLVATWASITLESTEDARDNQQARYSAYFYNTRTNKRVGTLLENFTVPPNPTETSWPALTIHKMGTLGRPDKDTYTKQQILDLIASLSGPTTKQTDALYGIGRLSVPAADSADPVVVADNDQRVYDASSYASLDAAVTSLTAVGASRMNISTPQTVTSDLTIPTTVSVNVFGNGKITISSGKVFNPRGPFNAELRKVFYGAGTVSFANSTTTRDVPPEWWGAVADAATDSADPINAADASVCSGALGVDGATVMAQGRVRFQAGVYKHTGLTYRGAPWVGAGDLATILQYYGSGIGINAVGTDLARINIRISQLMLDGTHASAGAKGIVLGHNQRSLRTLDRVRVFNFPSWGIFFAADSWIGGYYDVYVLACGNTTAETGGIGIDPTVATLASQNWYNLILENNGKTTNSIAGGIEFANPLSAESSIAFWGGTWEGNKGAFEARFLDVNTLILDGVYLESDASVTDGIRIGGNGVSGARPSAVVRSLRAPASAAHGGKALSIGGHVVATVDNFWYAATAWTTGLSIEDFSRVTQISQANSDTDATGLIISTGFDSVNDQPALTLVNRGENGNTVTWNNSFGNLGQMAVTKVVGSPSMADDGKWILRTATDSVLADRLTVSKDSALFTVAVKPGTFTVSTLPTPAAGMVAYVTDGDSGLAWGATVINSGAGSTKYLVFYNGTNWTVAAK